MNSKALISLLMVGSRVIYGETAVNYDVLFGNSGSIISSAEETELAHLFSASDLNNNLKLSKDEFSLFLANKVSVMSWDDDFAGKDINGDGLLSYNELVYYFKTLIMAKPAFLFDGDDMESAWREMSSFYEGLETERAFDDETSAEFIASELLYGADIDNSDSLSKSEFIKYMEDLNWMTFVESRLSDSDSMIAVPNEINFEHFKSNFFESVQFRNIRNEINLMKSSPGEFAVFDTINAAHNDFETVLNEIDSNLVFQVNQLAPKLSASLFGGTGSSTIRRLLSSSRQLLQNWAATKQQNAMYIYMGSRNKNNGGKPACYDDYSLVYELNKGEIGIKDLSVGDYVYDGSDYTKIFFIQRYEAENYLVDMFEIKYGVPADDSSLILTPTHLLYLDSNQAVRIPVLSKNVQIGDVLSGQNKAKNYTVYDIQLVKNRKPINPITVSGNLMVNNIQTSVFSHSVQEHNRLKACSSLFVFISNNIHEQFAANLVDFYYNIIYKNVIQSNESIFMAFTKSYIFAMSVIVVFVPIALLCLVFGVKYVTNMTLNIFGKGKKGNQKQTRSILWD